MSGFGLVGLSAINLIDCPSWGIRLMFVDESENLAKTVAFKMDEREHPLDVARALEGAAKAIRDDFEATNCSPKGTEGEDAGTRA